MNKNKLKCSGCGIVSEDVYNRPNAFQQDVHNDPTAFWVACDKCDENNRDDI